jgi:predicted glycoside hydrolase/deacetylase ChbG (UPF0249 family)
MARRNGATAKRRLIVSADDFGRTPGVNRGVVEAHRKGLVSSASLMVVGKAALDAFALARDLPSLGVGLHIVLSGGAPLTLAGEVASLVTASGRFPVSPDELTSARPQDVRDEVRAQFERFIELMGRKPTHVDTHHHAHRVHIVFDAVVALCREQRLPLRAVSTAMRKHLRAAGLVTTDEFIDIFHGESVSVDLLKRIFSELRSDVSEIMTHPGYVDEELRRSSRYVEARERELSVLTDPEVQALPRATGVKLIHYGALSPGRALQR